MAASEAADRAVVLGIILFHEPASFLRMLFLGLILIGIVGLKFTA